jgi:hypothetical protein
VFAVYKNGTKAYKSKIYKNGVQYDLGLFTDEILAAKEYDKKAVELYTLEYANLNFPDDYEYT